MLLEGDVSSQLYRRLQNIIRASNMGFIPNVLCHSEKTFHFPASSQACTEHTHSDPLQIYQYVGVAPRGQRHNFKVCGLLCNTDLVIWDCRSGWWVAGTEGLSEWGYQHTLNNSLSIGHAVVSPTAAVTTKNLMWPNPFRAKAFFSSHSPRHMNSGQVTFSAAHAAWQLKIFR